MTVRITDPAGLAKLAVGPLPRRVELSLESLQQGEAQHWQSRLNKELSRCGCGEAAAALLIGLPVFFLTAWVTNFGALWQEALFALGAASAAMILAKLIVIACANRRFRRIAAELAARFATLEEGNSRAQL